MFSIVVRQREIYNYYCINTSSKEKHEDAECTAELCLSGLCVPEVVIRMCRNPDDLVKLI